MKPVYKKILRHEFADTMERIIKEQINRRLYTSVINKILTPVANSHYEEWACVSRRIEDCVEL